MLEQLGHVTSLLSSVESPRPSSTLASSGCGRRVWLTMGVDVDVDVDVEEKELSGNWVLEEAICVTVSRVVSVRDGLCLERNGVGPILFFSFIL